MTAHEDRKRIELPPRRAEFPVAGRIGRAQLSAANDNPMPRALLMRRFVAGLTTFAICAGLAWLILALS